MDNLKEMQTVAVCRFGGPLFLFICTPIISIICVLITRKEILLGKWPATKNLVEMILVVLLFLFFGLWMCKRGYGWFEWLSFPGKNKNNNE